MKYLSIIEIISRSRRTALPPAQGHTLVAGSTETADGSDSTRYLRRKTKILLHDGHRGSF
jgi:hypothetical protein